MSLVLDDGDVRLYHGDALTVLQTLEAGSVHMCVTSPPFYGLRSYLDDEHEDKPLEIGLEETPEQWVENLVNVFREVRRVLRDDGVLFCEVGDSYAPNWSSTRGDRGGGGFVDNERTRWTRVEGYKPKDLIGAPWMLAKALQQPYYTGTIRDERDRIWLAAMVDGEGSIGIHRRPAGQKAYSTYERKDGTKAEYNRTQDSFQPKVEITSTDLALIEHVIRLTGEGTTKVKQEAGTFGRKQTIYRWTLTADKARAFLRELYPHLIAKRHEARLGYGCPSSGPKATAAWQALKELHQGGSPDMDLPPPETLHEEGWYLRSDIIWARRPNPMPESVTDRPTKAHSYVFLLAKQPRYYWDADAVREAHQEPWRGIGEVRHGGGPDLRPEPGVRTGSFDIDRNGQRAYHPAGRNVRSVWNIATQPFSGAHFATFPEELVRRCILAGTSERGCCPECGAPWIRQVEQEEGRYSGVERQQAEGAVLRGSRPTVGGTVPSYRPGGGQTLGWRLACTHGDAEPVPTVVIDPFVGSGTVPYVARKHGRHAIGIDLSASYLELAARRLQQLSLFA